MSWGSGVETLGIALKAIGFAFLPFIFLPVLALIFYKSTHLKSFNNTVILLIDGFSYRLGEIVKWALPLLVISVAFSIFALSIFGLSWTKLFESAQYFHASVIMIGAAATLLAGQHVRVDIFYNHMTPQSKALVDFCGYYLCLLPVCLIILWNSQATVSFAWRILEGSAEATGIRGVFYLQTLVPLFALLMILQGLSITLRAAMCLRGQNRPPRPEHTPPLFGLPEKKS